MKKNWIAGAIKHPGALHKELGVPSGVKIPRAKLEKAAHKPGKEGQRARLAETLESLHSKGKKMVADKKVKKSEHKAGVKGDKKLHKMAMKRKKKKEDCSCGK